MTTIFKTPSLETATWFAVGDLVLDRLLGRLPDYVDIVFYEPQPPDRESIIRALGVPSATPLTYHKLPPRATLVCETWCIDPFVGVRSIHPDTTTPDVNRAFTVLDPYPSLRAFLGWQRLLRKYPEIPRDSLLEGRVESTVRHLSALSHQFPDLELDFVAIAD